MQWNSACQAIPTFNSGSARVVWAFEEPSRFGARIDVFRPGRALPSACFPTASTSKRIRGQDSQASFQTISITQSRYIFRSVSASSGFNWPHVLFKSLTQRRCAQICTTRSDSDLVDCDIPVVLRSAELCVLLNISGSGL